MNENQFIDIHHALDAVGCEYREIKVKEITYYIIILSINYLHSQVNCCLLCKLISIRIRRAILLGIGYIIYIIYRINQESSTGISIKY